MSTASFVNAGAKHANVILNHDPSPGVVVAMGGGGARGLAHLGAMEAIGGAGVRTERIVGVSIGSLMGSLCAIDLDIKRVQAKAIELLHSPIFSGKCRGLMDDAEKVSKRKADQSESSTPLDWFATWYRRLEKMMRHGHRLSKIMSGPAMMSNALLNEAIESLIPDIDIRETNCPLSIVAADLKSGHRVVIESGSLRRAILASMSIPGFFPPIQWDGMLLTDIGVLDSIPVLVAQSYGLPTIAIDVGSNLRSGDSFGTTVDVMLRMEELGEAICRRHALALADVVIRPDVGEFPWYDFTTPEQLIDLGRNAGKRSEVSLKQFSQSS
ncbi:patatin-like phospholipase family protein [Stieleria sp. JC731]|uniref:patatin-like phospholipase family protein n=1 Tax=Pirellulaceae TaxID=2691357 RepID=UPI001E2DEFBD|nr:patatin-like phospholipase family protein [Stieleria sp. JC731]MCC9602030.1 patatin-like phospholipase family protein [Stieleria sp. JC731]